MKRPSGVVLFMTSHAADYTRLGFGHVWGLGLLGLLGVWGCKSLCRCPAVQYLCSPKPKSSLYTEWNSNPKPQTQKQFEPMRTCWPCRKRSTGDRSTKKPRTSQPWSRRSVSPDCSCSEAAPTAAYQDPTHMYDREVIPYCLVDF